MSRPCNNETNNGKSMITRSLRIPRPTAVVIARLRMVINLLYKNDLKEGEELKIIRVNKIMNRF